MSGGVEIKVDEKRLQGLSGDLGGVYNRLSALKYRLEELHFGLKANWSDPAVEDFSRKYEEGMERIWDLLVAVDNMEGFFTEAATAYIAADQYVESL